MARSFGAADNISVTNTASLVPTGNQSQACWIQMASISSGRVDFFASWAGVPNGESWLLTVLGGPLTFWYFLSPDGSTPLGVDSLFAPTANIWYHVCGTWDGTNQLIYVNGLQKNSATPGIGSVNAGNQPIQMGHNPGDAGLSGGIIADCAIWNTNLTAAQVLSLYNGVRPNSVAGGNLVGWWPLDGYASPESDLSGNGHTGALTGTSRALGPPYLWRLSA